jgi:hypothetical protein
LRPKEDAERLLKIREVLERYKDLQDKVKKMERQFYSKPSSFEARARISEQLDTERKKMITALCEHLYVAGVLGESYLDFGFRRISGEYPESAFTPSLEEKASPYPLDVPQLGKFALHESDINTGRERMKEALSTIRPGLLDKNGVDFIYMDPPLDMYYARAMAAHSATNLDDVPPDAFSPSYLRNSVLALTHVYQDILFILRRAYMHGVLNRILPGDVLPWMDNPAFCRTALPAAALQDLVMAQAFEYLAKNNLTNDPAHIDGFFGSLSGARSTVMSEDEADRFFRQACGFISRQPDQTRRAWNNEKNPFLGLVSIWELGLAPVRYDQEKFGILFTPFKKYSDPSKISSTDVLLARSANAARGFTQGYDSERDMSLLDENDLDRKNAQEDFDQLRRMIAGRAEE